jgi:hypothetical protein
MASRFSGVYELDGGTDVRVFTLGQADHAIVWTEWGGWHWRAEAADDSRARTRLETRLTLKDPFYGRDKDWGPPGFQLGTLDVSIEPETRGYMERVSATVEDFHEEVVADVVEPKPRSGEHPKVVAVRRCASCGRLDLSQWHQVRSLGFGAEDWVCAGCGSKVAGLIEMRWDEYEDAKERPDPVPVSQPPPQPVVHTPGSSPPPPPPPI